MIGSRHGQARASQLLLKMSMPVSKWVFFLRLFAVTGACPSLAKEEGCPNLRGAASHAALQAAGTMLTQHLRRLPPCRHTRAIVSDERGTTVNSEGQSKVGSKDILSTGVCPDVAGRAAGALAPTLASLHCPI